MNTPKAGKADPQGTAGRLPSITEDDQSPEGSPTGRSTDDSGDGHLPVVTALAVPPLGRRVKWMLLVENCPFCGGGYVHVHRASSPTGGRRTATCDDTSEYWLHVRTARPRPKAADA